MYKGLWVWSSRRDVLKSLDNLADPESHGCVEDPVLTTFIASKIVDRGYTADTVLIQPDIVQTWMNCEPETPDWTAMGAHFNSMVAGKDYVVLPLGFTGHWAGMVVHRTDLRGPQAYFVESIQHSYRKGGKDSRHNKVHNFIKFMSQGGQQVAFKEVPVSIQQTGDETPGTMDDWSCALRVAQHLLDILLHLREGKMNQLPNPLEVDYETIQNLRRQMYNTGIRLLQSHGPFGCSPIVTALSLLASNRRPFRSIASGSTKWRPPAFCRVSSLMRHTCF
jgi:hypothetical protein